jgi:hypothetical protein
MFINGTQQGNDRRTLIGTGPCHSGMGQVTALLSKSVKIKHRSSSPPLNRISVLKQCLLENTGSATEREGQEPSGKHAG